MDIKMAQYAEDELAKLIIENPDLPVYKMCGEQSDCEDDFVLQVSGAEIGKYWVYNDYVYDDYDYLFEVMAGDSSKSEEEVEDEIEKLEHGDCIWLAMDYAF